MALGRVRSDQAVQVDQQNQAAVGSDGGAGEKFYAAQIIAEILDDDFVLAENFFDDDADVASRDFHNDHVEIAVQRLERRQGKLQIEAHDFGDHAAHAREQLSANIFDFLGLQAANFLDHRQRERKHGRAAANEQRLRNDQRERHLYREARAAASFRANFDFAVQRVDIGAHNVEADAAAGKFGG